MEKGHSSLARQRENFVQVNLTGMRTNKTAKFKTGNIFNISNTNIFVFSKYSLYLKENMKNKGDGLLKVFKLNFTWAIPDLELDLVGNKLVITYQPVTDALLQGLEART
jgi:hypothetical protein